MFGFDWILHPFHISEPMLAVILGSDGRDLHSITDFTDFLIDEAGRLLIDDAGRFLSSD